MGLGFGIRDPGSRIQKKPIPDPGSKGQKGTGSATLLSGELKAPSEDWKFSMKV
jgi:hypothetical protein